jgi:hypothetical protein
MAREEDAGGRDLSKCFGRHRDQTVDYAMANCLQCRKLKSCVRASWGANRNRRWNRDDWWQPQPVAATAPKIAQQHRM